MEFSRAVPSQRVVTLVRDEGAVAWVAATSTARGPSGTARCGVAGAELMVLSRTDAGWRSAPSTGRPGGCDAVLPRQPRIDTVSERCNESIHFSAESSCNTCHKDRRTIFRDNDVGNDESSGVRLALRLQNKWALPPAKRGTQLGGSHSQTEDRPMRINIRLTLPALTLALLAAACGGSDNALAPQFQPEVVNTPNVAFSLQATGLTDVSDVMSYTLERIVGEHRDSPGHNTASGTSRSTSRTPAGPSSTTGTSRPAGTSPRRPAPPVPGRSVSPSRTTPAPSTSRSKCNKNPRPAGSPPRWSGRPLHPRPVPPGPGASAPLRPR